VALIAARLAAVEPESPVHQVRSLAEIRIGINMIELRRGRRGLPDTARQAVETLMDGLSTYFAGLEHGTGGPPPEPLVTTLDTALASVGRLPASTAQANVLQGLVGVYRGLCPQRTPPAAVLLGAVGS
jgi:hypothetical protein